MSGTVTVLAPNGRRQTVKVTPNTTILQIIEEVCKKQGYKPDEYDIKHHKKVLDTTSVLRFTGLPNNAQLELIAATKVRSEGEVVLGIHLEDGRRLMGNFSPSISLWEVIMELCPSESDLENHPVIIYMRTEVYGSNLQNTTLKSLGLTNGRAMLRLIHRHPETLKTQANISAPLPVKPVEEKPYLRQFKPIEHIDEPSTSNTAHPTPNDAHPTSTGAALDGAKTSDSPPPTITSTESSPPPKKASFPPKTADLLSMAKQEVQKHKGGSSKKTVRTEVQDSQSVKSGGGRTLPEEFVFLGERNAMIFSLETAQAVPSEDLPDDFFDLTINDAKKLLRDIKKRRLELENGQLLTSNLRNLEESKKQLRAINKYKRTIIRVQFPDRTILQGTFTPSETVENVMNFISGYLEDKATEFYVYTTPPKTVLEKESRLLEIGCVPGALLYFGYNSANTIGSFLRQDLLDKFTSPSLASLATLKMRQEATNPNALLLEDDEVEMDVDVNVGASTSADPQHTYEDYEPKPVTATTVEKVPKWFKPTK